MISEDMIENKVLTSFVSIGVRYLSGLGDVRPLAVE